MTQEVAINLLSDFCPKSLFSQGQVIYSANTGYVMTQGPGSVPVAIPMQAGGGMVSGQTLTPGAQGGQPRMVMVPVSGAEGYQPQLVQATPTGVITAGYQLQQVEMPPPYAQGQYILQQNEQVKTSDVNTRTMGVWRGAFCCYFGCMCSKGAL